MIPSVLHSIQWPMVNQPLGPSPGVGCPLSVIIDYQWRRWDIQPQLSHFMWSPHAAAVAVCDIMIQGQWNLL